MFKSKHSEMEYVIQKDGSGGQNIGNTDAVVRLRGLPFVCTHEDIVNFFKGRFCQSVFSHYNKKSELYKIHCKFAMTFYC